MTKLEEMLEQYLPGQKLSRQEEILHTEPEQPKQKKVLKEEAGQPKQKKVLQEEPEQHKESHKGCTYTMYTSVAEGLRAVLAEQKKQAFQENQGAGILKTERTKRDVAVRRLRQP